jgi:putative transposase
LYGNTLILGRRSAQGYDTILTGAPSTVTVIRDAAGRYFVSFVLEADPAADSARFPAVDAEAGIDLGLTSFAVLSNGTVIRSPRFLRRAERKLHRLQKSLSRKVQGSSNQAKARVKVARVHARVADSRRDFHHKVSTAIIRDNQAVYVEDLCLRGLARGRLAKSVHDAGIGKFVSMLEYKAKRYGRWFGKIGRWVPSTSPCSGCGVNEGRKPLHVRQWTCTACGAVHDRDLNAAQNILALGRRERQNACGDGVRPPLAVAAVSETGTRRGAA